MNCNTCKYNDVCDIAYQEHYLAENGNLHKCFPCDLEGFKEAQKYVDDNHLDDAVIRHIGGKA